MDRSHSTPVLVAPLNWGLGHATRCIPLIRYLEKSGKQVVIASDGEALQLLRAEFPKTPAFSLPSYHIRYSSERMVWNIARQLPRILYAIRTEQWATERLVREHGIAHIISDNRYGCFTQQTKQVLLTHQIHLRVNNAALQWTANKVLRQAITRFDEVWVPDAAELPGLSGALSHPPLKGIETKYLGVLSRFQRIESRSAIPIADQPESEKIIAVVLSGPEPQRSYLEQILLEQALALPYKFVVVQGKPRTMEHHFVAENVELISYLCAKDLQDLLLRSHVVVSRAGYSSLMDLAIMRQKKALLIPTPGQTEQEYLGELGSKQGLFVCQQQHELDLEKGFLELDNIVGFESQYFDNQIFEPILKSWIATHYE